MAERPIVTTLPDGRMAIAYEVVANWPGKMREWIEASNYWQPSEDPSIQAYVSPVDC